MKKALSILITSILILTLLSGFTTKQQKYDAVTVKMAVVTSPTFTAKYWDGYMRQIEKDNPGIKMEAVLAPSTDRSTWMKTKYAAGDIPDIIATEPGDFASVDGALAEVPAYVLKNFSKSAIVKNNGKILLVPASLQIKSQVYYNKKLFSSAGINSVPKTWNEFLLDCQKLKAKNIAPIMSNKEAWFTFGYYTAVCWADMLDKDPYFLSGLKSGKEKWNNPTMVSSLKRWQELTNKGYYHKGSNSFSYTQSVDEFFKGSAAMIINGSWMAPQVDGLTPKPFDIGVFPLPQINGVKHIGATTAYWGVFNSSKVKDSAFKVINYCINVNKDLYKGYLQNDNLNSVTNTPVTYAATPTVSQFNKNVLGLTPIMDFTGLAGDNALPTGFGDFINNSFQSIYIGQDVVKTLNTMDKEYQRLINK